MDVLVIKFMNFEEISSFLNCWTNFKRRMRNLGNLKFSFQKKLTSKEKESNMESVSNDLSKNFENWREVVSFGRCSRISNNSDHFVLFPSCFLSCVWYFL
jgi:hypothetical protein